jgi:hypothetical protein
MTNILGSDEDKQKLHDLQNNRPSRDDVHAQERKHGFGFRAHDHGRRIVEVEKPTEVDSRHHPHLLPGVKVPGNLVGKDNRIVGELE